jgi:hypothetical protein
MLSPLPLRFAARRRGDGFLCNKAAGPTAAARHCLSAPQENLFHRCATTRASALISATQVPRSSKPSPSDAAACSSRWRHGLGARSGSVILDEEAALHKHFGCNSEGLYLVRPDGYVGFRCQPAVAEKLYGYLETIFKA